MKEIEYLGDPPAIPKDLTVLESAAAVCFRRALPAPIEIRAGWNPRARRPPTAKDDLGEPSR